MVLKNMDDEANSKFAILAYDTKMCLHQTPDILIREDHIPNEMNNDQIIVIAGELIKIYETKSSSTKGQNTKNLSTIQVLDFRNPIYENLYECPQANLIHVSPNLWPYVISIANPKERLQMIRNEHQCRWLQHININDIVSVSGKNFNMPSRNFICIIRYIGPVDELNAMGYFYGLELLELSNGTSPQANIIPFANKYTNCGPNLSIFTTANWISKVSKDQQKNCSTINFVNDKIKPVIATTASAQCYQTIENIGDSCTSNNNNNNKMERNKQSIENRDKSMDRRSKTTNTAQTQTQPQGILKNKHKDQSKSMNNSAQNVCIDEKEINESVAQASKITAIDGNSKEGNRRLSNGGDAAGLLNRQKIHNGNIFVNNSMGNNTITTNKSNRNKSNNANDSFSTNKNVDNKNIQKSHNDKYRKENYNIIDAQQPLYVNTPSNHIDIDADFGTDYMKIPLGEVANTDLELGSVVEVNVPDSNEHLYGVIRWIGKPPGETNSLIGVELEDDCIGKQLMIGNGGYNGISYFKCPNGRGIYVTSDQCSIDRRFLGAVGGAIGNDICESNHEGGKTFNGFYDDEQTFGHMECPVVPGAVAPEKCSSLNALEKLCGKFKGIQGHNNSCYLDVTLFSMFAFTTVFDVILYRPPEKDDILQYNEVQTVLREEIVNPLRKHMFVRADRVMKLRQLLDKLSSVSGLTSEEKDPEEFLNCLLSQIMRADPFLKLNSGQDAYYYQFFVEKDERLSFPSVQQLFEQSFYTSDIKLKEVPSCLIIQLPRSGKSFKMYPRILPSQVLDVTDVIDDSPRQCSVCGKLAEFECRDCYGILQTGIGLESTSFCEKCLGTVHSHVKRTNHTHRKLSVPQDFRVMAEQISVPRVYMELFAVVCIETSHYVTFVKAGSGPDAPWCFFDSMADRKGELNGYNIPKMITVPELPKWLSDDGARTVNETSSNDKLLPEHAKRLFCDAYMCMYQSTDVMMYR